LLWNQCSSAGPPKIDSPLAAAIVRLGPPAVPFLVDRVLEPAPMGPFAASLLLSFGPDACDTLVSRLEPADSPQQERIRRAIVAFEGTGAERLAAMLLSRPDLQMVGVELLRELGPFAVPHLVNLLGHSSEDVSRRVESLLKEIGKAHVPAIVSGLASRTPAQSEALRRVLIEVDPGALARAGLEHYAGTIQAAAEAAKAGRLPDAARLLDSAPVWCRGWEWDWLAAVSRGEPGVRRTPDRDSVAEFLTFSADGTAVVTGKKAYRLADGSEVPLETVAAVFPTSHMTASLFSTLVTQTHDYASKVRLNPLSLLGDLKLEQGIVHARYPRTVVDRPGDGVVESSAVAPTQTWSAALIRRADDSANVVIYDLTDGREASRQIVSGGLVEFVDDQTLMLVSPEQVVLVDVPTQREKQRIHLESPDPPKSAPLAGFGGLPPGRGPKKLEDRIPRVLEAKVDPTHRYVGILSLQGEAPARRLVLVDLKSGRVHTQLRPEAESSGLLTFSPDGRRFAAHIQADRIGVWETSSGMHLVDLHPPEGMLFPNQDGQKRMMLFELSFDPSGRFLAAVTVDRLLIWGSAESAGSFSRFPHHSDPARAPHALFDRIAEELASALDAQSPQVVSQWPTVGPMIGWEGFGQLSEMAAMGSQPALESFAREVQTLGPAGGRYLLGQSEHADTTSRVVLEAWVQERPNGLLELACAPDVLRDPGRRPLAASILRGLARVSPQSFARLTSAGDVELRGLAREIHASQSIEFTPLLGADSYIEALALVEEDVRRGDLESTRLRLDECESSRRGWEWGWWRHVAEGGEPKWIHDTKANLISFSADGRFACLVESGIFGPALVVDAASGETVLEFREVSGATQSPSGRYVIPVGNPGFSFDGKHFIVKEGSMLVATLLPTKGQPRGGGGGTRPGAGNVRRLDPTAGRSQFPVSTKDNDIPILETSTGRWLATVRGVVGEPRFSPDEKFLAVIVKGLGETLRVISLPDGKTVFENKLLNLGQEFSIAFNDTGDRLIVAGTTAMLVLEPSTGKTIFAIGTGGASFDESNGSGERRLAIRGRTALWANSFKAIEGLDLSGGVPLKESFGRGERVAFVPGQDRYLTIFDGTLNVYQASTRQFLTQVPDVARMATDLYSAPAGASVWLILDVEGRRTVTMLPSAALAPAVTGAAAAESN
jgi:WD40 repeat protein